MSITRIAGAALNQTPLDWDNNISNIIEAIEEARLQKVEILCLPELCISGYGCEDLFLSSWLPLKSISFLDIIAEACKNIIVAVGLPMRHKGELYNCACIIHDQEILGFNPKQNLANDGVHYEPRWFTAWNPGVVDTIKYNHTEYKFGDFYHEIDGIKIGFEICEDAWRENLRPGKWLFSQGVDLILNPSASHFAFGKSKLREALVVSSSLKFDCTYVYANLLGNEAGRMIFDGEILISKKGALLQRNTRLSFKSVNLIVAEVDFKTSKEKATSNLNPDEHDKNTEFVKASALALFDYMRKSRSNGFVLSLSGGADSSTCAVLVAEMIKRGLDELGLEIFSKKALIENHLEILKTRSAQDQYHKICSLLLSCAYQGTKNSTDKTYSAAEKLANSIGATFHHWLIDEEVQSYTGKIEKAIGRSLSWETDDITLQNIQARVRSPIIWMLTNIKNALLIATSNRSEGDVGYTTMDGDTSGSISPIAAVDKHFILGWLKWAEKELGYEELKYVNSLSPSAELRPHEYTQTDEADLMPYHIIVKIEELAIRDRKSPIEVYDILRLEQFINHSLLKSYIIKFFKMWSRSQWKRERFAPSFHLDDFNIDSRTWCRFPILSGGFISELSDLEKVD
ncbi:MAG: NAD+ synthetase [Bacteroidota bacterium]|nr:NAD+ synthetase [Bacteroidota bacterium]